MELVESSSNFYLNCEQYTTEEVACSILIQDRDDILKRQDRWCVHVTRFAVDTQASLFYVAPDPTATLDLELFAYRGSTNAQHRLSKKKFFIDQRSFNLSKGAATLADLLDQRMMRPCIGPSRPPYRNFRYEFTCGCSTCTSGP